MTKLPDNYDSIYLPYVKEGSRVLALAWKPVKKMSQLEFNAYTREEAESDLIFCGFIIAECPLKPDTLSVMEELTMSSH
jgi:cation-transporting ATPase 13A1